MRIIGGEFKGRRIEPPAGFKARPTTDFARESLLNILDNRYNFAALSLLDLFAGTGAISYEFASRGCRDIDLVEPDRRYCQFISRSFRTLAIDTARIHRIDVRDWLKICHKQYDIVFADPPYELEGIDTIPDLVFDKGIIKDDGWLILEHSKNYNFETHPRFVQERHYGSVHFSFFK